MTCAEVQLYAPGGIRGLLLEPVFLLHYSLEFKTIYSEGKSMYRSLHMEPSLCTGCLQCEMACSFEHEGEFNPSRSRIRVFEFEHGKTSVPYSCTQ